MIIACWSGPRNLSTAMMYSFAARGDCHVMDEPFYAAYLAATGLDHPMRDEVLASQPQAAEEVIKGLFAPVPQALSYHKHMTQHMLEGIDRSWLGRVTNLFLIRHPARVVASYSAKRENPSLDDIGFRQQAELYDHCLSLGLSPVVIDSFDIRQNPAGMLEKLCRALGIDWTEKMLSWPKGGHASDGVWAPHWYGAVHGSTGFAEPEGQLPELTGASADLVAAALPYYQRLERAKLV